MLGRYYVLDLLIYFYCLSGSDNFINLSYHTPHARSRCLCIVLMRPLLSVAALLLLFFHSPTFFGALFNLGKGVPDMAADLGLVDSEHQRVEDGRRQVVAVDLVALVGRLLVEQVHAPVARDALVEERAALERVVVHAYVRGRRRSPVAEAHVRCLLSDYYSFMIIIKSKIL